MGAAHIFFVFLAAFGLFAVIWAAMGFFLPSCGRGLLICTNVNYASIYLWLRGFGIVTCPLLMLEDGLSEAERAFLESKDIEVHSRASLMRELGKDI